MGTLKSISIRNSGSEWGMSDFLSNRRFSGLIFPPNVPRHRDSEDNAFVRPDAEYLKRLMSGFWDVTKPTTNIGSQLWNAGSLDRS